MKVLIIEDDDEKGEHLLRFLSEQYGIPATIARSFQSGLRAILDSTPDLILLDMTMRNYDRTVLEDGGRPHAFAGREILRQMRRERLNTPVIVVTHFDRFGADDNFVTLNELSAELKSRFPNYLGTVQFKNNVDDWKPSLASLIDSQLNAQGGAAC
jgi:CheY-like chemotaxis protein